MTDLAIRNGMVVTERGVLNCDVGVKDGLITRVGDVGTAREQVDASGMYVMPGGVDGHTHLDSQPTRDGIRSADDFYSGTVAAACGGITTIVDYARQYPDLTLAETIEYWDGRARGRSVVDYGFHLIPVSFSSAVLEEFGAITEAGFPSFKLFMHRARDDEMLDALHRIAAVGAMAMIHAESRPLSVDASNRLVAAGLGSARNWAAARPTVSEFEAVQRAIDYCAYTKAFSCFVHISSGQALERIRRAKEHGLPIWTETRPCYLFLTEERYGDPAPRHLMFTGYPPLRSQTDVDALWSALANGPVDMVGSDHASWTIEQKSVGDDDFTRLPMGLPSLQFQNRVLYSEGVVRRGLTVTRFVELTSSTPARLLGLYPRKGVIAEGSDADLVVFHPTKTVTIDESKVRSGCGYEPLSGVTCTGWPIMTISRGEVIVRDDEFVGTAGRGHLLHRSRPSHGA